MKRRLVLVAVAVAASVIALTGAGFALQSRIASRGAGEWIPVKVDDLVLGVDITGQLEASSTESLGPPHLEEFWDFKVSMMAPEGSEVKQGQPILAFDTSELRRRLEEFVAEADSARKEIEKKQADLKLGRRDLQLKLAEAEARLRKAKLKLEAPPDVAELNERKKIEFDFETATEEVSYRRSALTALERNAGSEISLFESKLKRASDKVAEIQRNIGSMTVVAPRNGTVIYLMTRRSEKKKVGDSAWRGEKILDIPDLNRLRAIGEVDESDAGRVVNGQKVSFRLDALPDDEIRGKVVKVGLSVQRSKTRSTVKVMKVGIDLDRVDATKMRPGMRFRGTVETGRVRNALLIPAESVEIRNAVPVVVVKGIVSNDIRPVQLGRRNNEVIQVTDGLRRGDVVLRRKVESDEEKP